VIPMPDEVVIEKTPFDEKQAIAREIDNQMRAQNPDFKGAFHEKKFAPRTDKKNSTSTSRGRFAKKGNSKPSKRRK
ncbi:MAG: DEAD/DEAH box helicase, partial [Sphingobacterium sp.]